MVAMHNSMFVLVLRWLLLHVASGVEHRHHANPIRKVVTLLQTLSAKVETEGEKEKAIYEEYHCYCKDTAKDLQASIKAAEDKVPELESSIEAGEGKLTQLQSAVASHKDDRTSAKKELATAKSLRERDRQAFEGEHVKAQVNLDACNRAIVAISKGLKESFLQTSEAVQFRDFLLATDKVNAGVRDEMLTFLQGGDADGDAAPGTSEVLGIMKQMQDEMVKEKTDMEDVEAKAISSNEELLAVKKVEIDSLSERIEVKLQRIGALGVETQEMKNELRATSQSLEEDKGYIKELKQSCATQKRQFEDNTQMRHEELVALADAVKVLNDDDALDVFSRSAKSQAGATSFLQVEEDRHRKGIRHRPKLDLTSLILQGKKIGFDKVLKMVDDLVGELRKAQTHDDEKVDYCKTELKATGDKRKQTAQMIEDTETSLSELDELRVDGKEEVTAIEQGLKQLDKSVVSGTNLRKEQNEEFQTLVQDNNAAKDLLKFAINRLNKFYNPSLASPQPALLENGGPPPLPPSQVGAFKKSGGSTGIIGLMNQMVTDIDLATAAAETEESQAQEEYEEMTEKSKLKRVEDSKRVEDLNAALGTLEEDDNEYRRAKYITEEKLAALIQQRAVLHGTCDWLMRNYEIRKKLRGQDVENLQNAYAVLRGASMQQISSQGRFLA